MAGSGGPGRRGTHLHLRQVSHPPRDLPGEGDEVTHGQGPLLGVVQVAGAAAASTAHVARPGLAALSEESPQGAVLGVLHNEEEWPWRVSGGCELAACRALGRQKSGQLWEHGRRLQGPQASSAPHQKWAVSFWLVAWVPCSTSYMFQSQLTLAWLALLALPVKQAPWAVEHNLLGCPRQAATVLSAPLGGLPLLLGCHVFPYP